MQILLLDRTTALSAPLDACSNLQARDVSPKSLGIVEQWQSVKPLCVACSCMELKLEEFLEKKRCWKIRIDKANRLIA